MDRLTIAAVALTWIVGLEREMTGTRAARILAVQRDALQWDPPSLAESLRAMRPDSLTERLGLFSFK